MYILGSGLSSPHGTCRSARTAWLSYGWLDKVYECVSTCDYQNGSAAGVGKSLAMCFGAIVALSKVLKSVSGVTSLSFHQDRWLPETLTFLFNKALRF